MKFKAAQLDLQRSGLAATELIREPKAYTNTLILTQSSYRANRFKFRPSFVICWFTGTPTAQKHFFSTSESLLASSAVIQTSTLIVTE